MDIETGPALWVPYDLQMKPLPATMRQRLHPEATWAKPYYWHEVSLAGLSTLGPPVSVDCEGVDLCLGWPGGVSCRIAAVAVGVVRMEWTCDGVHPLPPSGGVALPANARDPDASACVEDGTARVRTGGWVLEFGRRGGFRWRQEGDRPAIECRSLALAPAKCGLRMLADFALAPDESIHGCGGRTGPVNRRGSTCDFFAVKVDGPENGDYGGLAMPFAMTSRGAGIFMDNPWPHVYADFGYEDPKTMRWYAPAGPVTWYLMAGPFPRDVMRRWHTLTGTPVMPPPWYFGLWMSLCARTTARDWTGWIDRFRNEGWPLDVVVLDLEWRGGELLARGEGGDGSGLEWHESFGDGAALIRHADKVGVRVCLHLNTRQFGASVSRRGLSEGWLRQVAEQVVIDPSTSSKSDAAWALHAPRVAEGAAVWWTDNGERVDGELGEGLPSRNLFGSRWNAFLYDRMEMAGLPGRLVLSRGDWVGAQRHCTPWPGDTCPGVDRLGEDLRFILNCAVSGVPFSGTDLGAFRNVKDDGELMVDRMQGRENLARRVIHGFLYQPIARVHNSGPVQKFPWVLSDRLKYLFRVYIGLRYRLMPWWVSGAIRAVQEGVPLVRPLWFDYPDDPALRGIDDEVLVGDGLLAAPVVRDAAWERVVHLPAGLWYHYWTGVPYGGGRDYIIDASADEVDGLPLFVRAGTLLAYGPPSDRCPDSMPDELWLVHYPGCDSTGHLQWAPDNDPSLSWSVTGTVLCMECGERAIRIHVTTGHETRTVDIPSKGKAQLALDASGALAPLPPVS